MNKALLVGALIFTTVCACLLASAAAPVQTGQVRVAFVGDPQIGYGDLWGDYFRFSKLVHSINRASPDFVVIPGDLVQSRSPLEQALFDRSLSQLQPKAILAPGNHDIVDKQSLDDYRRRFGADYFVVSSGPIAWIVLNSETARSPKIDRSEFEKQWTFFESALDDARKQGKRPVLIMHRPPFAHNEQEPDSERGWPDDTRARLLELCREHGVSLILAGHLHTSRAYRSVDGIEIRVLGGTARSFDGSPIGYEELVLDRASHHSRFRAVGPPPHFRQPSLPGMRDWTPRLLDFSWGHWFFTLAYLVSALSCRSAARGALQGSRAGTKSLWGVMSLLLFFFALNTQLDLDEFVRSCGRIMAKLAGVSSVRHLITGTGLLILIGVAGKAVLARWRAGHPREEVVALVALAIPSAWFVLSTISHHDIGMLFGEFYWDVLTLLSLAIILLASRKRARAPAVGGHTAR